VLDIEAAVATPVPANDSASKGAASPTIAEPIARLAFIDIPNSR